MMNNVYIRLMIFLYTAEKSSVDFEIANVLLEVFDRFPDILIEDIARMANTTPASVTKFAHKLQYKNFKDLRNDCVRSEGIHSIPRQLSIAKTDYQQACANYLKEEQQNLAFYMQYHDDKLIQKVAALMSRHHRIGICYTHYSYPCVHVMRNYLEPFAIQVQGILRDLDEDFIEARLLDTTIVWLISLQGDWIIRHMEWLCKLKQKGKVFMIITAVYDDRFKALTPYIFPFQFKDTILDTAAQISCLFVKLAFAYANFPKLEKS